MVSYSVTPDTKAQAGPREWAALAVLALPALLISLDLFVMLMALPRLSVSLRANSVQQLWMLDIYGFMVAGFLITMGSVGDRFGRRKLLLAGAAVFSGASVLTAYSANPAMLIASRAVLGLAGASITPSTLALIMNLFKDVRQRAVAMGIWAGCFTIGAIIGPLVGGVLLSHFWWGSVFLIGVPVMVLLLILGPVLLPESRNPEAGRIDLPSVALSLGAIFPSVYGLKELASSGWHPAPAVLLAAGLATGVVFVRRQNSLRDPLLDLRLFSDPAFSVTLAAMLMYSMLSGGTMAFIAQHLQLVDDLSPLAAGLAMAPGMSAAILSFQLAPVLGRRVRPAVLFPAGIAISVAGLLVVTQSASAAMLATGFALSCFGTGPLVSLGTNMVVGSAPPQKAGAAAGIAQTSNECGYALGVAILGSAGIIAYRAYLSGSTLAGVPAGSAAVAAARQSIGSALSVANGLPGHTGAALRSAAQSAFTAELHTIAAISAILLAAVATLIAATLRDIPPLGQERPTEPVELEAANEAEMAQPADA